MPICIQSFSTWVLLTFGVGNSLLQGGACGLQHCLAASVPSTHQMLVALSICDNQKCLQTLLDILPGRSEQFQQHCHIVMRHIFHCIEVVCFSVYVYAYIRNNLYVTEHCLVGTHLFFWILQMKHTIAIGTNSCLSFLCISRTCSGRRCVKVSVTFTH